VLPWARMRTSVLLFVLLALAPRPGAAAETNPDPDPAALKGVWKVLVRPKAKWVLEGHPSKDAKIVVETYDVRKIAGADVARVRWTYFHDGAKEELANHWGHPTQIAVTAAGLYVLAAEDDDAAVAEALKKKPFRSDPPKPYAGTTRNEGRYLHLETFAGGPVVCMGEGPLPGAKDEEAVDALFAEVCISPRAGVVVLDGYWSPGHPYVTFSQPKFKRGS
jgi:hypothetical protein